MSKIWMWTKIVFFGLVFLYIVIFCSKNNADAKVWVWFDKTIETHVLPIAFFSFLAGVVSTVLVRTVIVTFRQFREMQERKRSERLHRDMDEMKSKAALFQPKPTEPLAPPVENPPKP